ncbi:ABC transporter substrate-binding protein [Kutzneria sp. NPDC052558]|uniref:ABC transporter substrate-binding protein n=1 Tax=Kutzneria sp. NPDC052558 TaxID=3364121 RepID=UPI0037C7B672
MVRGILTCVGAAALALTAACSPGGVTTTADGLQIVNVGISPSAATSAPMYLAVRDGVFRKLGLQLTMTPQTDSSTMVPDLLSGKSDFGMVNFGPLVSAVESDLPVRMVGLASEQHTGQNRSVAIVVAGGSTAADMRGMRTFANSSPDRDPLDQLAVTGLGGDYRAMQLVSVPPGSIADVVASGRADAGRLFGPFLSQALATGRVKVLHYVEGDLDLGGSPASPFAAALPFLTSHPDVAQRFVQGVTQAYAYAASHQAEIAQYVASTPLSHTPLQVGDLPGYPADGVDRTAVQQTLDLYEREGYLTKQVAVSDVVWSPPSQ